MYESVKTLYRFFNTEAQIFLVLQKNSKGHAQLGEELQVKSLYRACDNFDRHSIPSMPTRHPGPPGTALPPPMSIHGVRRDNLQALLLDFCQAELASGSKAKGLEQAFAAKLQISPSRLSQLKGARNISDAMAMQIEHACKKPTGWLSTPHPQPSVSAPSESTTEGAFLNLARLFWKNSTEASRYRVMQEMEKSVLGMPGFKPEYFGRQPTESKMTG